MSRLSPNDSRVTWSVIPADQLADSTADWDSLNRKTLNVPVLDAFFYIQCLKYFGTGRERLALAYSSDQLLAAGIFGPLRFGTWSSFQPAQAPLGAWIALPELEVKTLWSGLQRQLSLSCLILGITQQDPKFTTRPNDDGRLRTLDYIDTACINVAGSFKDYWSNRGRNLRQNLRRQRNRLEREGVATRLERVDDSGSVADAVDEYGRMESEGWKGKKGTALHPDNAQGRFYRTVLKHFASTGNATVYRYWYDDTMVATDLCVHRDGVLIILKTAHNEEYSKTSPTHLMRQEMFEHLFDGGEVRCIEFYGRLMDWHTKWSDEIRRMYHVNRFRWSAIAAARKLLSGKDGLYD